jgi:hypothetical protein
MNDESELHEPVEHITVWVDGGIHIKTSNPYGDPVEMSEDEALALADLLRKLVQDQR